MDKYLYQVPKNHSKRNIYEISPNERRDNQYMTHQMIAMHDQIEEDYHTTNLRSRENLGKIQKVNQRENYNTSGVENYGSSPNLPKSMKPSSSQRKVGKSTSRSKPQPKPKKVNHCVMEENIPENMLRNMNGQSYKPAKEVGARNSKKHMELLNILKEREVYQSKGNMNRGPQEHMHDYNDVDDTFTYSMEPESMMNSKVAM